MREDRDLTGVDDCAGVREIVRARGQDSQRMRGHSHDHERRDQAEVKQQDDGQPMGP